MEHKALDINNLTQKGKAFGNSLTIQENRRFITFKVSNRVIRNLFLVGLFMLLMPISLEHFFPPTSESDLDFMFKLKLIYYSFPLFLFLIYVFQQRQNTTINTVTKVVESKKKQYKPSDIVDFDIEQFSTIKYKSSAIYLLSNTGDKILIGATTKSVDIDALEHYAKTVLDYLKS